VVKWLHVIATGTSLLRNFEFRFRDRARELGIEGWFRLPPGDPRQEVAEGVARAGHGNEVYEALRDFLVNDPEGASAELNAFLNYVRVAGHAPPSEVGVLVYSTDTGVGYLCATLIHEYLRSKGYATVGAAPVRVEGLGTSEESFDDGLANLLDRVISVVKEEAGKGVKVYVNATAGFKAETSFLILAATLANATAAYYIHEAFREVIELPLPPLSINPKVKQLVTRTGPQGISIREFEDAARNLGLNPQELLERKLFVLKETVKPRKWLTLLIR